MTREQAWALLAQYNKEPFHLRHAITVEHVMGWFAQKLGYGEEKEFWSLVGLLHDLDFEMWPEDHCIKSQELMREAGIDEAMIRATACHGWGHRVDIKPRLGNLRGYQAGARDGEGALRLRRAHRPDWRGSAHASLQECGRYGAQVPEKEV